MNTSLALVLLFSIATIVALVIRRLKIPYTVALVIVGLGLGQTHLLHVPVLSQELLYTVFLPGLIFEAAYHLEYTHVRESKWMILGLVAPGVVMGTLFTAALLLVAGRADPAASLPLRPAILFAALIAATDPIAVVALFKEVGAPRRLSVLVEGESLLNDGTAVVLLTTLLALFAGTSMSIADAAIFFARTVGIGVAVGAALGFGVALVIRRVDEPVIEITLTAIASYGSFAIAEDLHGSGVLATVTAGMICGSYIAKVAMSERTRASMASFWEWVAFALNSIIFLLIGFAVDIHTLLDAWMPICIAYVVSIVVRVVVVGVMTIVLRRTRERITWSWSIVLAWGGLRGALSMVLALALPDTIPHRDRIVAMTFGVVLLSLVVQGLTMGSALRWFGITADVKRG
jgi:CPA1 family monovalent cation:H+ antiporter